MDGVDSSNVEFGTAEEVKNTFSSFNEKFLTSWLSRTNGDSSDADHDMVSSFCAALSLEGAARAVAGVDEKASWLGWNEDSVVVIVGSCGRWMVSSSDVPDSPSIIESSCASAPDVVEDLFSDGNSLTVEWSSDVGIRIWAACS